MNKAQRVARAELASAAAVAKKSPTPTNVARVGELSRDYRAEALAGQIETVVAQAPPLTPGQRDRLALLLKGSDAA